MKRLAAAGARAAVAFATLAGSAGAIPAPWKNCTAVNKRYPHGVGRRTAHDSTSRDPVTDFKRSTLLYNTAMRYNRGLDRDKDGIACQRP